MERKFKFSVACVCVSIGLLTACADDGDSGDDATTTDAGGDVGGSDSGEDVSEDAAADPDGGRSDAGDDGTDAGDDATGTEDTTDDAGSDDTTDDTDAGDTDTGDTTSDPDVGDTTSDPDVGDTTSDLDVGDTTSDTEPGDTTSDTNDGDATSDTDLGDTTSDADAGDPCAACDENATCVPEADDACACDAGYVGDGEECRPVVEIRDMSSAQRSVLVGEPTVVSLDVVNAVSCSVTADYVGVIATFDAAQLAAPFEWTLDDTRSLYDAVVAETNSEIQVFRMTCFGEGGEANVARAGLPIVLTQIRTMPIALSSDEIATGEEVEICWDSPEGTVDCGIRAGTGFPDEFESIASGLGGDSCFTYVPPGDFSFIVECADAGGTTIAAGNANVTVDGGPVFFEGFPSILLAGGGTTMLTWDSNGVDGCTIRYGETEVPVGPSGTMEVDVTTPTAFFLDCDGSTLFANVFLPGIYGMNLRRAGSASAFTFHFTQTLLPFCDVTLTRVAETSEWLDLVGSASFLVEFENPEPAGPYSVTALVTCEGIDGRDTGFVVYDFFGPPRIDAITANPERVPSGGGEVEFCWESSGTEACTVRADADGFRDGRLVAVDGCIPISITRDASPVIDVSCVNSVVRRTAEASLEVGRGPQIDVFEVNPGTIDEPGPVEITFSASFATECLLFGPGSEPLIRGTSGSVEQSITSDTVYFLECTDSGGGPSTTRSIRAFVGGGARDFRVIYSSPGALIVDWQVVPGSTCVATFENNGEPVEPARVEPGVAYLLVPFAGLDFVGTLSCTFGASNSAEFVVTVGPPSLSASLVNLPTSALLCWNAPNHMFCNLSTSRGFFERTGPNDCRELPRDAEYIYSLECVSESGEVLSSTNGFIGGI